MRRLLLVAVVALFPFMVIAGALALRGLKNDVGPGEGGRRKLTRIEFDRYARKLLADVSSHPDDEALRERLVGICLATGQDELALQHLAILQERAAARDDDATETRLGLLAARTALDAGMPTDAEAILGGLLDGDGGRGIPPGREEVFEQLASIVANARGEPLNAEMVFDRMTDAYPLSARAWAGLGSMRLGNGKLALAEAAYAKAAGLDADDARVALLGVELALARGDFDEADRLLRGPLADAPANETTLLARARTAAALSGTARGIEMLREGCSTLPESRPLVLALVDALADSGGVEELRQVLSGLEARFDAESAVARYGVARLAMLERRWLVANQLWLSLEREAGASAGWRSRLALFRAACEEALGRPDRAAALRLAGADAAPQSIVLADVVAYEREGRPAEALALFRQVADRLPADARPSALLTLVRLQLAVQAARLPSARDWSEIDGWLSELDGVSGVDPDDVRQVRADVRVAKGQTDAMLGEVEASLADRPDDAGALVLTARLLAGSGRAAEAIERLASAPPATRDDVRVIAAEISVAGALPGVAADAALAAVESRLDALSPPAAASATRGLFAAAVARGDDAGVARLGARLLAIDGDDLAVRQTLLESAVERGDVEAARRQADALVGRAGRDTAEGRVATALAELAAIRSRLRDGADGPSPDALPSAERRGVDALLADLEEVARENAEWPMVHRALATAEEVAGDPGAMVGRLRTAARLEREPVARRRLVLELVRQGRVAEALPQIAALGGGGGRAVDRVRAELAVAGGDVEGGLAVANGLAPPDCRDVAQLDWWAGLLARAGHASEAEAVCRRSIELDPGRADPWITLLAVQSGQRRFGDAEKTRLGALAALRGAEVRRFEEAEAIATGRVAALVNRVRSALEVVPDDLATARWLADFLLRHGYRAEAERELLRIVDLESARGSPTRGWACRRLAESWAEDPGEAGLKRATDLLAAGTDPDGEPSFEDMALAARLTLRRTDPVSWRRGVGMMSRLAGLHRLTVADRVLAATVGARLGERFEADARRQLTAIVDAGEDDPNVLATLAELHLDDGSVEAAGTCVARLRAVAPRDPATLHAEARLALAIQGREAAAVFVRTLIGEDDGAGAAVGARARLAAAAMAEELGFPDEADRAYAESAQRDPESALAWARSLAGRHRIDEATDLLERVRGRAAPADLLVSLADVLSHTRDDAAANRLVDLAESLKPAAGGAVGMEALGAVVAMRAGRTDEARGALVALLGSGRLEGALQGAAEANLAALLAVPATADEAALLIDRAIERLGPQTRLLDTRAMVRLARGQRELALEDVNEALLEPTAVGHLHRATILDEVGDVDGSRESFERARAMGLESDRLLPSDAERFDRLRSRFGTDGEGE